MIYFVQLVPSVIRCRGPLAVEAYNNALKDGKAYIKRVPVMIIGQNRAGKTSLKKSLTGETFSVTESSTEGIEMDPSHFKVSTDLWKTGKKSKETDSDSKFLFDHHAAKLMIQSFKKEKTNHPYAEESTVVNGKRNAPHRMSDDPSRSNGESSAEASQITDTEAVENPFVLELSEDVRKPVETLLKDDKTIEVEDKRDPISLNSRSSENVSFRVREESSVSSSKLPVEDATLTAKKTMENLLVPELPDDIASLVENLLQNDKTVEEEDEMFSILWDFGGESVYYATHPIFLTEKAIYILAYDLSRDPHAKAGVPVRKGLYRDNEDTSNSNTNMDYLDFWMSSVYSLVSPDASYTDTTVSDMSPVGLPPVFLVCTHADKPYCSSVPRDLAREIYGFLRAKIYGDHLFKDVFVVDNTKSGSNCECPEVIRLRGEILTVARKLPQMKESIPLKWLRYENILQLLRKDGFKWIPVNKARQIASDECGIDDDEQFRTAMNFLHDQRILIHLNETPELENMVILDPQWLIDVFKKVITIKSYERTEETVEELWLKFEKSGILDERLLNHAWNPLFERQETCESLLAMMERFSLLCSWPSQKANKEYLVPSMLMSPPTDDVLELLASVKIPLLYVRFKSGRVPPGLFSRLVLQFYQWCKEEWDSPLNPELYHNFALFHILPDQGTSVIFLCHSSSIEIVIHSGNDAVETDGAGLAHGNVDLTTSRAIHRQLAMVLECMQKEFDWLKHMHYEMCVCCPVCSQTGSVKCRAHDVRGCECLHLLSEKDLQKCKYCIKPGVRGDCRIRTKMFLPWFSFSDVQQRRISLKQVGL